MNKVENIVNELVGDCDEVYHKNRSITEKIQLMEFMINEADSLSKILKSELREMKR